MSASYAAENETVLEYRPGSPERAMLKRLHHILTAVAEPRIGGRRIAGMGVHDGQDAQLPTGGQLVMHEVHRPDLVGMCGIGSVFPKLGFHPSLGRLVPQLQAQLVVKPAGSLHVDRPAFPLQQDMYTPIAIPDPRRADLLDPELEIGLLAALGLVGVEGTIDPQDVAGPTHRHLPDLPHLIHKLAPASRP
jgi:hypothetical protein